MFGRLKLDAHHSQLHRDNDYVLIDYVASRLILLFILGLKYLGINALLKFIEVPTAAKEVH